MKRREPHCELLGVGELIQQILELAQKEVRFWKCIIRSICDGFRRKIRCYRVMAFMDSYSAWTMLRPVSPETTLMEKGCSVPVPSASSTSIRPVFAQKLTP